MEEVRLGNEILKNAVIQFAGTVVILILMVLGTLASWWQGRMTNQEWGNLIVFVLVVGVAWPFMMGKYDFETGRVGAYLAQQGSAWEISPIRHYRKWMLPLYDIGASLPVWFLFGHAVYRTWQLGMTATTVGFSLLYLIGVALFICAPLAHRALITK